MSYKFSTGSVRRGDIYYEDDREGAATYIDFSDDSMALRPSGSAVLQASASNVLINALVVTGSEVPAAYATTTSTALVTYGSIEIKAAESTEALRIRKESGSDVREIVFENNGTDAQEIYTTGDAFVIRNAINNEDIIFRVKSNNTQYNMFRLDSSAKNISINNPSTLIDQCLTNDGGYAGRVTSVTSTPYTIADGDWLVVCSGNSAKTLNLPAASDNPGRILQIKDAGGNANSYNITVDGNGSETIDGSATYVITQNYACLTVVCTGAEWVATSVYSGPPP